VFEISGSCSDPIVLCGFNTVFEFNASDNFGRFCRKIYAPFILSLY
jgi:hypothetical protein